MYKVIINLITFHMYDNPGEPNIMTRMIHVSLRGIFIHLKVLIAFVVLKIKLHCSEGLLF